MAMDDVIAGVAEAGSGLPQVAESYQKGRRFQREEEAYKKLLDEGEKQDNAKGKLYKGMQAHALFGQPEYAGRFPDPEGFEFKQYVDLVMGEASKIMKEDKDKKRLAKREGRLKTAGEAVEGAGTREEATKAIGFETIADEPGAAGFAQMLPSETTIRGQDIASRRVSKMGRKKDINESVDEYITKMIDKAAGQGKEDEIELWNTVKEGKPKTAGDAADLYSIKKGKRKKKIAIEDAARDIQSDLAKQGIDPDYPDYDLELERRIARSKEIEDKPSYYAALGVNAPAEKIPELTKESSEADIDKAYNAMESGLAPTGDTIGGPTRPPVKAGDAKAQEKVRLQAMIAKSGRSKIEAALQKRGKSLREYDL